MMHEQNRLSPDELERLAKLHSLELIDSEAEAAFDGIVKHASELLDVPMSVISLVDRERQWFKAHVGVGVQETPRERTFCDQAIRSDAVMVVPDTHEDPRFCDIPLVTQAPGIRAYAGAPLRVEGGYRIGVLCAMDTRPRHFTEQQIASLRSLAQITSTLIDARDIARRAKASDGRLRDAVEALADGFVLFDPEDRLVICNERYKQIYEASRPALVPGTKFTDILAYGLARGQYPEAVGREDEWLNERLQAHRNLVPPFEQQLPGDRWIRIDERRTRDGGLVGFRVDITALKRRQREFEQLATRDSLTGALSRGHFLSSVAFEIGKPSETEMRDALLVLDLDHFKTVNDTYGHLAGDQVLLETVGVLQQYLKPPSLIGRLGGEEFGIFLRSVRRKQAVRIAERLCAAVDNNRVLYAGRHLQVTASIGVTTIWPSEQEPVSAAMERADNALYAAKRAGRNRVAYRFANTSSTKTGALAPPANDTDGTATSISARAARFAEP